MLDMQCFVKRLNHLAAPVYVGLILAACSTPETGQTSFADETIARYPTLQRAQPQAMTPEAQASARIQAAQIDSVDNQRSGDLYLGRDLVAAGGLNPAFERAASGEGLVLNFDAVDLPTLSEAILGDILNVPYAVDPRVNGVVNLKSTQPVPRDSLIGLFEVLLKSNGAALVIQDELYRVVPENLAPAAAQAPVFGDSQLIIPSGYSVQVIPLAHVDAKEVKDLIKPLTPGGVLVEADPARNLLLVAANSVELVNLIELVQTFDIDWLANRSIGVFPVKSTGADVMIKELSAVFDLRDRDSDGRLQLIEVERLNAVMVIANQAATVQRVEQWIDRLDRGFGAERTLHVYKARHARVEDLAPLLNEVFGQGAPGSASTRGRAVAPGFTAATLGRGSDSDDEDTALPPSPRAFGFSRGRSGSVTVIPYTGINALLVTATAQEYEEISQALRQLDIPPRQVLVEATIAEVTLTDDLRFGLQYFFTGDIDDEPFRATLNAGSATSILPTAPGFSFVLGDGPNVILDTLESVTSVNVISSPNLMVLDNRTARLNVGDEVPVAVQSQENAFTDDDVLVNTIEFRDTGVIFEVTPRVNEGGMVDLEITQEVSSVPSSLAGSLTPTISTRRIESSVSVQSGETIVLGGLFSDEVSDSASGLPVLAKMPLVGPLFGSTSDTITRTELIVLLQPKVVTNTDEARAATRELQDRLRLLRLQ